MLFDEYGHFKGSIPDNAVDGCSHVGDCFDDVEYWQRALDFNVPRARAIAWLRETGAWTRSELEDMGDVELAQKVLWIACCEIKENGIWWGLTN
jgi:hypothetical protein